MASAIDQGQARSTAAAEDSLLRLQALLQLEDSHRRPEKVTVKDQGAATKLKSADRRAKRSVLHPHPAGHDGCASLALGPPECLDLQAAQSTSAWYLQQLRTPEAPRL